MSDIKLFKLKDGNASELQGNSSDLEKPLQTLIENNLESLLGVRFLATEYSTGKTHAGRIDSLGIDENGSPVILEYKRSTGENVINQGLFYLDWLLDHKAEFELLVMKKYGQLVSDTINWSQPRLVCIAGDFTKYDAHAVQQMNREIQLIRYRLFEEDLLLFELVNSTSAGQNNKISTKTAKLTKILAGPKVNKTGDKSYAEWIVDLPPELLQVLSSLEEYIFSLGDDIEKKELKLYSAFKRIKNFATVVLQKNKILLFLHLNPSAYSNFPDNLRDVREIGHWGTGDIEFTISTFEDLEKAKAFIVDAYEGKK
jgi:predicted transport protein